jgi:hypothetical protein
MEPVGLGNHGDLRTATVESGDGKESFSEDETGPIPLTESLRVSVGWPTKGGTSLKKRVIGQCFPEVSSGSHTTEIFISPTLDDPMEVAETLVHELTHAAVGCTHAHNRRFAIACARLGLEGKPTSTSAGPELREALTGILSDFPPYPHDKVTGTPRKTGTGRFKKAYCKGEDCPSIEEGGFSLRITQKWATRYDAGTDDDGDTVLRLLCPDCGTGLAFGVDPLTDPDPDA